MYVLSLCTAYFAITKRPSSLAAMYCIVSMYIFMSCRHGTPRDVLGLNPNAWTAAFILTHHHHPTRHGTKEGPGS